MISVIIPTYNSARFLPAAIASVRGQSCPIQEIIVVDDGSTDDTAQVASSLGKDIVYLRQSNAGPAAARNLGITHAKGDYLCFLDADDQWTSDKTETQLSAMDSNPELALVASDMAEIDISGHVTVSSMLAKHNFLKFFLRLNEQPIPNALALLVRINFIPTGTVMIRRSVLIETGGFRPHIRYGEDLELWARVAAHYPIACLPHVHLLRLQHESNSTKSIEPLLTDLVAVMSEIRAWGTEALRKQGVNPNILVAQAWANLGYWHFSQSNFPAARLAFIHSLRNAPSARAFFYMLCCFLPSSLTVTLRRMKQIFFSRTTL